MGHIYLPPPTGSRTHPEGQAKWMRFILQPTGQWNGAVAEKDAPKTATSPARACGCAADTDGTESRTSMEMVLDFLDGPGHRTPL